MKVQASKQITIDQKIFRTCVVVEFRDRWQTHGESDEQFEERQTSLSEKRARRILQSLSDPKTEDVA